MAIADTVKNFLAEKSVNYELIPHSHTATSHETSLASRVSEDHIAKAVVVKAGADYAIVVIPANNWLKMGHLRHELNRNLQLATKGEIASLFDDCEPDAVPPRGPAYGIETLLDESLTSFDDVYFEAGDHEQRVHLRGEDFQALLSDARRGYYSHDS